MQPTDPRIVKVSADTMHAWRDDIDGDGSRKAAP